MRDSGNGVVQHFRPRSLQFVDKMNIGRGDKHMDAGVFCIADRFPSPVDVLCHGTAQRRNRHSLDGSRDPFHRFEIPL